jgi:hypothetical protein
MSFFNPATWLEKAEQLRLERQRREEPPAPSTFFQMANAGVDLSLDGGQSAGGYVAGSEPFVRYPASGYSGGPQPGLEPPLGVEIDQKEPTGTPSEVARSIGELADAVGPAGSSALRVVADDPSTSASAIPALAEVSFPSSAKEAEPLDPAVPVVDRGSAISSEEAAHARLRHLMRSGDLFRRTGPQVKRRRL